MHPRNLGAGLPDGGLYTPDQLAHSADGTSIAAQVPARGAVEVKPIADAVEAVGQQRRLAQPPRQFERPLVPDPGIFGAAELAAGEADQVGNVGMVVLSKRAQNDDRLCIILLPVDRVVGVFVTRAEIEIGFLVGRLLGLRIGLAVGRLHVLLVLGLLVLLVTGRGGGRRWRIGGDRIGRSRQRHRDDGDGC